MAKSNSTKSPSAPKKSHPRNPSTPSRTGRSRRSLILSILIFGVVFAVFFSATRNGFLYWYGDDTGYVTENVHVKKGLSLAGVKWAFRNVDVGNWHPVTWLSHMLDVQMFGMKPSGHHFTSVLLHALNAVLVFLVLRQMTAATWRSFIVALLFGLHPLRAESVAWVAERKDVLAAFFWMLTLWIYLRYVNESKAKSPKTKAFYVLALAGFAGGLMSKGMVVTLPFVLLLLDYWPLKRHEQKSAWKLALEKVPFFCLAAATSVVTFAAQKSWGFVQTVEKYSLATRVENAVVSHARYIGKMFWPVDLSGYYPHPGDWPTTIVIAATIFLLGISVVAVVMRRKWPWLPVGWFWYLGTLVPVIGLVQLADIAIADRYTYIPMIGFLVALVWGLHEWTKRWSRQTMVWSAITTAALLACIAVTREQISYFKDSVTLWRHNFEATGDVDVAQYALGLSLSRQGNEEAGIKELQAVLKAKPERAEVHFNVGNMFNRLGRAEESIIHYREAVKYQPEFIQARYNLGAQLYKKGQVEEAIVQVEAAAKADRKSSVHDPKIYITLGSMLSVTERLDEAIDYFKEALRIMPNAFDAHLNLGRALAATGRNDDAIHHFQEALKLDANSAITRSYLDTLQNATKAASQ